LIALFQPLLGNGVSKLATRWFSDNERALATAIGSLSLAIGCIIGMVLGPFYINSSLGKDPVKGKEAFVDYLFFTAILATVMNIYTILFFEEKPKYYPS